MRRFLSGWMLFMAGGMIFTTACFIDERIGHVTPLSWKVIGCMAAYGVAVLALGIYLQSRPSVAERTNP